MEYLSTVVLIIRQRGAGFEVTSVRRLRRDVKSTVSSRERNQCPLESLTPALVHHLPQHIRRTAGELRVTAVRRLDAGCTYLERRSRKDSRPGAKFLRVFCARVEFHECRFRGRVRPRLADVYYLVPLPPSPPGLMKSWAWREFFASVFESKGLISKYSGIRTYGKIALPRSRFGNRGEVSSAIRVFKERWQMAVLRHQGAASRSVSGDGQTSALANPIHSRAWRVGCLCW